MTPRALAGGNATVVAPETYALRITDTIAAWATYVRDMRVAGEERARGHERIAGLRSARAEAMWSAHTRRLRAQHGAEMARAWIARAEREAGR